MTVSFCWLSSQGVIDLLGSIRIIESDAASHSRMERKLVKQLAEAAGEFEDLASSLVHGGRPVAGEGGIAAVVSAWAAAENSACRCFMRVMCESCLRETTALPAIVCSARSVFQVDTCHAGSAAPRAYTAACRVQSCCSCFVLSPATLVVSGLSQHRHAARTAA